MCCLHLREVLLGEQLIFDLCHRTARPLDEGVLRGRRLKRLYPCLPLLGQWLEERMCPSTPERVLHLVFDRQWVHLPEACG